MRILKAGLMAAYRMTVHRVTGVTPNMAMLGRQVLLPASLMARPPVEPVNTTVPFVNDLRDIMRLTRANSSGYQERGSYAKKVLPRSIQYDKISRRTESLALLAETALVPTIQETHSIMDRPMEDCPVQKSSRCGTTPCLQRGDASCTC